MRASYLVHDGCVSAQRHARLAAKDVWMHTARMHPLSGLLSSIAIHAKLQPVDSHVLSDHNLGLPCANVYDRKAMRWLRPSRSPWTDNDAAISSAEPPTNGVIESL